MVYHVKLTLESKDEHQVHEMCNTAFKQLTEQGLTITGLQIAQSVSPTEQDELLLEKGLQGDDQSEAPSQAIETKPASQVQPGDPTNTSSTGWSTKPSSITDDGKNKTWDFGTKWV